MYSHYLHNHWIVLYDGVPHCAYYAHDDRFQVSLGHEGGSFVGVHEVKNFEIVHGLMGLTAAQGRNCFYRLRGVLCHFAVEVRIRFSVT